MAKKNDNKKSNGTSVLGIVFAPFKLIFTEIYSLISGIGSGTFYILDKLISFIILIISYIFWGIRNILYFLWKKFLGSIYHEIAALVSSIIIGFKYIFEIVFHDFPLFIYNKISKYIYDIYNYLKIQYAKAKETSDSGKTWFQTIRDYINDKYENLSFVKEAREKREASLIILTLNPNDEDPTKSEVKHTYRYVARTKEGKLITGYFAANSKMDVYSYLNDEGMTIYEIETSWAINFFHTEASTLKRKISNKDLIFWLAQLSTYIKAGIPLAEGVKVLAKQDKRSKYRAVYDSLIYELTMGSTFSDALTKQGNVFPALLINMIKSAELTGNIEQTLDEMSDYYQEIEDTKKAVIGAVTYPCIVLTFAIGILIFMMVYIIPKFVDVYESMDAELNPLTLSILNMSSFLRKEYSKIIMFVVIGLAVFIYMYKKVKAFRTSVQRMTMKLPVIGNLIIYKEISLFARTFATLNKNNVLLTDSIDILGKITSNEVYRIIMYRTINNLLKGEKMSDTFKDHWAVPEVAYFMILTGEGTGELANMLDKVGDYYQKLERNSVSMIKTFIEPILILFLAIAVGFILVAILIPMFGIYNTIS